MKIEKTRIHFSNDVFAAVAILDFMNVNSVIDTESLFMIGILFN